jgi:hypothetical protein
VCEKIPGIGEGATTRVINRKDNLFGTGSDLNRADADKEKGKGSRNTPLINP